MMRSFRVVRAVVLGVTMLAVPVLAAGCVGGNKGLSSEDRDKLKPYILDAMPTDIPHPVDINFENKVHIVGYKFDPEMARPGSEVKLTYWWRCDEPIEDGWALFTHIRHDDASPDRTDNLDTNGPIREIRNNKQILGPDRWEKGKFYVDEQVYKVPADTKASELTVMTGIWKNDARLRIVSGANDGDNRAIVGKLKTGMSATPAEHTEVSPVPSLTVNKLATNDKVVIDGKGDDEAWKGAASTGPFVDVGTGKPNTSFPVNATAKAMWDDTNLYVLFEVSDPDVVGSFTSPDKQKDQWTSSGQPKLWTKDTVEIMVDPDGDNKDYYELQINPQNKVFHSQYDGYNTPKTEPNGPFGHEDWDPKLKSAVTVKGTLDKSDDKDDGYTVEAAIPWAAFSKATNHPPKPGETWRINFYAMKNNSGVAWSAIMKQGNFHKASRFGKITWMVPGMAPPPAASASGAPSAAPPSGPGSASAMGPMPMRLPGRPGMPRGPMMVHPANTQQNAP